MKDPGWPHEVSPFHPGEQRAQARAGVRERTEVSGRRIVRDFMLDQQRDFFARLPFLIVGHVDPGGRPWASVLVGHPGFIRTPTARALRLCARLLTGDPLAHGLRVGGALGLLGIDLASRRRNRVRAEVVRVGQGELDLSVVQAFGNCPQYIHRRALSPVQSEQGASPPGAVEPIVAFGPKERVAIEAADTLFVASASSPQGEARQVVDASHRGGQTGFVRVDSDTTLTIPDFPGNNHFNTLGNFLVMPRAGLLFVDFECGDLSLLTGSVEVLWDGPEVDAFRGAVRAFRFRLEAGIQLVGAFPLRGQIVEVAPQVAHTGTWSEAERALPASQNLEARGGAEG